MEKEKQLDYSTKIYTNPIREARGGVKPHQQEEKPVTEKKPVIRRSMQAVPKVTTSNQKVDISVRSNSISGYDIEALALIELIWVRSGLILLDFGKIKLDLGKIRLDLGKIRLALGKFMLDLA